VAAVGVVGEGKKLDGARGEDINTTGRGEPPVTEGGAEFVDGLNPEPGSQGRRKDQ
jgi:hypothetical protein